MNLYFLVEGQTERKLYPAWLKSLLPGFTRVEVAKDASTQSYYIISGTGLPHLLNETLPTSIEEIQEAGNYSYLIIALDADEVTIAERIGEVQQTVDDLDADLGSCKLQIIVQQRCIESWLLGNRRVFQYQPQDPDFSQCIEFYDVFQDDPERMTKPENSTDSIGAYHKHYLRLMLKERNMLYSETKPRDTAKSYYLAELQKRVSSTPEHLPTFQTLLNFCKSLNPPDDNHSRANLHK